MDETEETREWKARDDARLERQRTCEHDWNMVVVAPMRVRFTCDKCGAAIERYVSPRA
jgi:hypothetical protein